MKKTYCFCMLIVGAILFPSLLGAGEKSSLLTSQTLYVPAYSHIYFGNMEAPFLLTVTLSIRNTDRQHSLNITEVNYHNSRGELVRQFLSSPVILKPLASTRYIIPEKDESGGSGANFIVEWQSESPINPPMVETVMIGARSTQGISFVGQSRPLF